MSNQQISKNLQPTLKSQSNEQSSYKLMPNQNIKGSPQKQEPSNVVETKEKLDNLIQDLNEKLVSHFKMKEQELLNQYKQQLIEQQKKLNQLKNTTNQEQIRAKMLQRKTELQRERNQLIQTNMFFSQKCEQYKQTYSKLVQQSKDLQKQIQFLDHQIQAATTKRINLLDQFGGVSERKDTTSLPISTVKKPILPDSIQNQSNKKQQSTLQKSYATHSMRKIAKSLHIGSESKVKKPSSVKNFQKIDKGIFGKTVLQKIFQQCVQQIKNRRKTKRTMPNLKGEQFTQYEKRAIMEIFLSNDEVKRKLYQIIFSDANKNYNRPHQMGEKVKISFDELQL